MKPVSTMVRGEGPTTRHLPNSVTRRTIRDRTPPLGLIQRMTSLTTRRDASDLSDPPGILEDKEERGPEEWDQQSASSNSGPSTARLRIVTLIRTFPVNQLRVYGECPDKRPSTACSLHGTLTVRDPGANIPHSLSLYTTKGGLRVR